MALSPGTRLGVYEVVALLGAGGMGEVYQARDTRLDRTVAVKILPSSLAADGDRLARFEREARVLASLSHAHIATIYGLEQSDGVQAIVMELVEGESLAEKLQGMRGKGLEIREAIAIARQIADALDAAHERGIVHRDLKPANIAISSDGNVKILDFGLAKACGPSGSGRDELTNSPTLMAPTIDGVLLGTAPYMSPEQARGKAVDKRTDIWAFGCVLYEMLTGRRAFDGETTSDTIAVILGREPDWTKLPSDTLPHVVDLIRRCLHKDLRRRLRDIGDGRQALDDAPDLPSSEIAARGRIGAQVGWIVAAALFGAGAVYGISLLRSSETAGPRVSRVTRLIGGSAHEHSPVISPDGKWVAYLSDARGPTDVWVKIIAGGDPINLTAGTSLNLSPQVDSGGLSISPDGSLIAVVAASRDRRGAADAIGTWVIPAPLGGAPRLMLEAGRGARWSPDGTKVTFIVQGGPGGDAIWVADADGANPREVAPRRGGMHKHWAAWSHDGRYIYFIYAVSGTNGEPSEIYRVLAAGGAIEPVVETIRRAVFPALTADGKGLIFAANPHTVDLGLWWKPLGAGAARQLTIGVGEYAEPVLTADGRRLVATLTETRQSLVSMPTVANVPADRIAVLTNGDTGDRDPTLSPDGRRLVFSSMRAGGRNLWIARPDGSVPRPLTSGDAIDERPAVSPDGQRIAFVSDRGGARGIWIINAEGGSPRLLVKATVLDGLSWSRDGSQLVFAVPGEAAPGLSIVAVDNGTMRPLATPGPASYPVWSPVSDVIAYFESRAVPNAPAQVRLQFVDGAGHSQAIPVFQPPQMGNSSFAWSADGRALAVASNSGSLPSVLWIVQPGVADANWKVADFPPDARIRGMTWSHDGTSLILGRQRRSSDIVLMDVEK